uniref:Uncharacterized protein n=1 Tax=Lactuca sativa TaxID=4236 RepID=A0A9R1VDU8_LACSA|nr:hypothetical protein LSAT_V11C500296100 [Lactuca sativa]
MLIFSMIKVGQRPRNKMSLSDDEMTSSYFMLLQKYVYGERKSVPSPVRDHFRRQDESSSSMSSSGRSHGRDGRNGKPNLEEVFVEEVNNEDLWNKISFEEPAIFQTNLGQRESEERNENAGCSRNKFDDDVFDLNEDNEAKEVSEEDDLIITGNVNYYDDYGFDGKEVTPDKPRAQNPSKYKCTPYIELHTTPKQKRRPKKKVDIKSTSSVPPPKFVVVRDFSVLRLQPYVASGEVVIRNYLFHSYNVQYRLYNLVIEIFGAPCLGIHTTDGWTKRMGTIGGRLCLVLLHNPTSWLLGGMSIRLGRGDYEKLNSDGTFTEFEARVADHLDKIDYWARRNIPRIPLNMYTALNITTNTTNY